MIALAMKTVTKLQLITSHFFLFSIILYLKTKVAL